MKSMTKLKIGVVLLLIPVIFSGCLGEDEDSNELLVEYSIFDEDEEGWIAEFSGFPKEMEDSMKLGFVHSSVYVSESIGNVTAIKQRGYAANSDLFMFVKQQVSGLLPNARYLVTIDVELNSQLLEEYGGSLSDETKGSFLKVGAFKAEPTVVEAEDALDATMTMIATDFDKGDSNTDGEDMVLLGKVEYTHPGKTPIILNGNNLDKPIYAVSDDEGKLWVSVGVDTNIPVYQEVAYTYIIVQFEFQGNL